MWNQFACGSKQVIVKRNGIRTGLLIEFVEDLLAELLEFFGFPRESVRLVVRGSLEGTPNLETLGEVRPYRQ